MEDLKPEQKMAQKISQKFGLKIPVDIQSLILKYADYEEATIPGSIDAICILRDTKPLVILNPTQISTRKRFTLAHELGHIVIPGHDGMISCHIDREDIINDSFYSVMEYEANNFAAELLMPTPWLEEMVKEHISAGLHLTLEKICKEADVSFSAAFFSLFKVLPSGYIAYVKNNHRIHGKRFESEGTRVFIPKRDELIDFQWLDNNATEQNIYRMDTFTIQWWKIDSNLSAQALNVMLEELKTQSLTEILNSIDLKGKGTIASSLEKIIGLLPSGYILLIESVDYSRMFFSKDTNVPIPFTIQRAKSWLNEYASDNGYYDLLGYRIWWWNFVVRAPQRERIRDLRSSKQINQEIFNDSYDDESEREHCKRVLGGIIGSLNNRNFSTFEDFYKSFKLRLTGDEKLKPILSHPKLEDFITNKINELLSRR
ncbi:ImmA/IrrE family metallo-endopeptidase [Paenibacillus spongiae]|uniref:ImmA/IrrE family metallo-endopeptidase n=1 Tax=Paenibacillus spongiae TaxID=2909671 RepID=A0ABY5SAN7_9BACL|nr:ImmA/IrrE family metallo-endopeptidase [Paenibacillus spongiae]UVI31011.1 ImmA/IrrE family metallo-endopeptidase [Paenibacillus spongiae]